MTRVLEAERKGREIIQEAEREAAELLAQARREADKVRASAPRIVEEESRRVLQEATREVAPQLEQIRKDTQRRLASLTERARAAHDAAVALTVGELLPGMGEPFTDGAPNPKHSEAPEDD